MTCRASRNTRCVVYSLLTVAQRRLNFFDLQSGLSEERLHQSGFMPNAPDGEMKLLVQLFQVPADQVPHLHVLEMVPSPFIPRVEVGGIAGKGLQPNRIVRVRDELRYLGSAVDRRAI